MVFDKRWVRRGLFALLGIALLLPGVTSAREVQGDWGQEIANALNIMKLEIGGAALFAGNALVQEDRNDFLPPGTSDPDRTQFDMAVNLDLSARINERLTFVLQLQGGPGGGNLGYAGPELEVADLNLVLTPVDAPLAITLGSYDTPMGYSTEDLANNGDTFASSFHLNSLYYSVFGGPVGTLNTLGAKAVWSGEWIEYSASFSNGTEEGAANPEGGFMFVGGFGSRTLLQGLRTGLFFQSINDSEGHHASGISSDVTAFMGDIRYEINRSWMVRGYAGQASFEDDNTHTDDDVLFWMGELGFSPGPWLMAVRGSGWAPMDDNADGQDMSATLPVPGFAFMDRGPMPVPDQVVNRYQVAAGRHWGENVLLRGEFFLDDYQGEEHPEISYDVMGGLLSLNVRF